MERQDDSHVTDNSNISGLSMFSQLKDAFKDNSFPSKSSNFSAMKSRGSSIQSPIDVSKSNSMGSKKGQHPANRSREHSDKELSDYSPMSKFKNQGQSFEQAHADSSVHSDIFAAQDSK